VGRQADMWRVTGWEEACRLPPSQKHCWHFSSLACVTFAVVPPGFCRCVSRRLGLGPVLCRAFYLPLPVTLLRGTADNSVCPLLCSSGIFIYVLMDTTIFCFRLSFRAPFSPVVSTVWLLLPCSLRCIFFCYTAVLSHPSARSSSFLYAWLCSFGTYHDIVAPMGGEAWAIYVPSFGML